MWQFVSGIYNTIIKWTLILETNDYFFIICTCSCSFVFIKLTTSAHR